MSGTTTECQPRPGQSRARLARALSLPLLVLCGALLLVLVAPQSAGAHWGRISLHRTRDQPYFSCARRPGRARCALITDPTRGLARSGPVTEGAITAGPEEEASPALSGSGKEGGYSPKDLRSAYNLPSITAGTDQTVAVVDAFNDPDAESDLKEYRSFYELPECTHTSGCFSKVNEKGGSTVPESEPAWAEEISLDLDMVSAICPNCHILLVEAKNETIAALANATNEAASLGATEISNSYGFELTTEPAHASEYDHPGIPITAAAGDSGYGVEWPAASPNVIAVGGTNLEHATNTRHWKESVWYGTEHGEIFGTGSGCSKEPKPSWQTDTGCKYRTNNDVAGVASQNTPVSAYDSYETPSPWLLEGGTSVSTPIIAAAMALATPYTRTFEGARGLYAEAALSGTGTLDDVTTGKNGSCGNYLCEAKVGYDGPTGLGSPWGAPEVPRPLFTTEPASAITSSEATLTATVTPNEAEVECTFEYGTTSAMGSSTPCSKTHIGGASKVAVNAPLSGLHPSTQYHFRVAGSYAGGPGQGSELTFSTPSAAPVATTAAASQVTAGSATLNASVDPEGEQTTCIFEYEPATSEVSSVPCAHAPGAGEAPVSVYASLAGLAPHTTYHFKIVATNATGTTKGSEREFKTLAAVITNLDAGGLTQTTATVSADVDPNGVQVTSCSFEYGTTSSFGSSAPCAPQPGAGESPVAVAAQLQGLSPDTAYRYRVAVTTGAGTGYSGEASFSTLPEPPTVSSGEPSSVGESAATASASIETSAELSACLFQYGEVEAGGTTASVPCSSLPSASEGLQAVSARLSGLAAGTSYEYRIVAGDAGGMSYGEFRRFTTAPVTSTLQNLGPGENKEEGNGPPPPPSAAALASTKLTVSRTGIIAVQIRCTTGTGSCTGTLTLRTLDAVAALKAHGPKRIMTLAHGSFIVSAGAEVTVKLHIDSTGRLLLSRARVLRARATIAASQPGSAANRDAIVTLRALKPSASAH